MSENMDVLGKHGDNCACVFCKNGQREIEEIKKTLEGTLKELINKETTKPMSEACSCCGSCHCKLKDLEKVTSAPNATKCGDKCPGEFCINGAHSANWTNKVQEVKSQGLAFAGADPINSPNHYSYSGLEPAHVIEKWGLNYFLGSCVKYLCRKGKKDKTKEIEDLKKARWFLDREISNLEKAQAVKLATRTESKPPNSTNDLINWGVSATYPAGSAIDTKGS